MSRANWDAWRASPDAFDIDAPETIAAWADVLHACQRIEAALRTLGYRFWCEDDGELPIRPAPMGQIDTLLNLDSRLQPVPGAFLACAKHLGEIDFRQSPEQEGNLVDLGLQDPFFFELQYAFSMLTDPGALEDELRALGAVIIEFAPDAYLKADISGGSGYSITVPSSDFDPIEDTTGLRFLDYVEANITRGGFFGAIDDAHGNESTRKPKRDSVATALIEAADWGTP